MQVLKNKFKELVRFIFRTGLIFLALPASATYVSFPLTTMVGGGAYTQPFTVNPVYGFLNDTNLTSMAVGGKTTITPSGGTNPVVWLEPNTYQVQFPDSTFVWQIGVPYSTNTLNAYNLTTNTVIPVFGCSLPYPTIISGSNVIVSYSGISNNYAINALATGGGGGVTAFASLTGIPYLATPTNVSGRIVIQPLSTNNLSQYGSSNIQVNIDLSTNSGFIYTNGTAYMHLNGTNVFWSTVP